MVLTASALGGCAVHPVRTPAIALPPAYERSAASNAAPLALDRWWTLFGDAQLSQLIDAALIAAPDARRALAVLAEARAERSRALAAFDPQGSLTASAKRQHQEISGIGSLPGAGVQLGAGDSTTLAGGFSPSWEIDLFGRRAATARMAQADVQAAQFDYEASRHSLAADVALNLFEARGLAVRIQQARDTLHILQRLADLGARRAAAGIGARADADALAADAATAAADLSALDAASAVSRRSLLVLVGRGADPLDSLPIAADLGTPPAIPATAPAELLVRRPDLRAAEARLASAIGRLTLDRLALYPTMNLLPTASATRNTGPVDYNTSLWSIGAGLTLPILDRGRLLAQIRAQDARTEQAVIAYEAAVQRAYGEAENRLTTLAADQRRLTDLQTAEGRARAAFGAQQKGYRVGIIDLTALLTAERTWRGNLAALTGLQVTTLRDTVDTFKALGGGWTPDTAGAADKDMP